MKLNSIVIGLGHAGLKADYNKKSYIKSHSKAYNLHPNYDLICAVEKKEKNRKLFVKKFNKPAYQNLNINLHENVEIFSVCVPTENHKKCIYTITNKFNPKIILCEKPLSNSINEAKDIIDKCKKQKIKLFVNYTRVTDPNFINLKKKISKYKNIKGQIYYDNGFLNNGSHYFNLMIFLFGNFISFKRKKIIKKMKNDSNIDITIRFKNAEIDFVYKKNPIKDIDLQHEYFYAKNFRKKFLIFNGKKKYKTLDMYQFNILNEIIKSLTKKKTSLCDGINAYKQQKILNKIINR